MHKKKAYMKEKEMPHEKDGKHKMAEKSKIAAHIHNPKDKKK